MMIVISRATSRQPCSALGKWMCMTAESYACSTAMANGTNGWKAANRSICCSYESTIIGPRYRSLCVGAWSALRQRVGSTSQNSRPILTCDTQWWRLQCSALSWSELPFGRRKSIDFATDGMSAMGRRPSRQLRVEIGRWLPHHMENTPRGISARTSEQQLPTGDRVQSDETLAVIILRANLLQAAAVIANDSSNPTVSRGLVTKLS
jgi:hypothetical protein